LVTFPAAAGGCDRSSLRTSGQQLIAGQFVAVFGPADAYLARA